MSAYGFMWDAIQSGEIHDLEKRIVSLEKDLDTAKEWIEYLNGELEKLKNETPQQ